MIRPRLYEAGTLTFENNGLGSLIDAKECIVKQGFGSMELEMQYPVKGRLFHELTYQRIILAKPEPTKEPQPFYIYRINTPMGGVTKVYAKQVCYKLDGCPVRPFTASTAQEAMEKLKSNAMTEHPFTFETDVDQNGNFELKTPAATWNALGSQEGSILDIFHGEYEFDGYKVRLLTRRGGDRGVKLRYGKNLQTLEQDANCDGCYTGVVPYWVDTQTGEAVYAEPVLAEGNFGYSRVLSVDFTAKFKEKPSKEQLTEQAEQYIRDNDIGVPNVSLKVKFVPLEQTEELRHLALLERVEFGDTVHVYFPKLAVDASARIVETVYDCLRGRYKEVTIGKVKQTLSDLIVNQQKQIEKIPQGTALQIAMAKATAALLGAKGGAVQHLDTDGDGMPDTIYVADNADPALANHVWKWNYEGWAASKNGYNGPFTMAATLEGGMVAEFITAGKLATERLDVDSLSAAIAKVIELTAERITTGKLSVDRLDVDNLVVKALRAVENRKDGFQGIVETNMGRVRIYANDGSVIRQVLDVGASALDNDFTNTWAEFAMTSYDYGVQDMRLYCSPYQVEMRTGEKYGATRSNGLYAQHGTGKMWLRIDDIIATGAGDLRWEYIESIGKFVLTSTEDHNANQD